MDTYQAIRNFIIEGIYEPGQRLTEEFLSAELNVSRTPIREAIARLESEGLVSSLKRGVSVRDYSSQELHQIYDLRAILESYAASLAAQYMDQDEVRHLRIMNSNMMDMIMDPNRCDMFQNSKDLFFVNSTFHEAIMRSSNNDYIPFLISKVNALPVIFRSYYWRSKKDIAQALNEHLLILSAIEQRDSRRAETAMAEHIFRGRDYVFENLSKMKRPVITKESALAERHADV